MKSKWGLRLDVAVMLSANGPIKLSVNSMFLVFIFTSAKAVKQHTEACSAYCMCAGVWQQLNS